MLWLSGLLWQAEEFYYHLSNSENTSQDKSSAWKHSTTHCGYSSTTSALQIWGRGAGKKRMAGQGGVKKQPSLHNVSATELWKSKCWWARKRHWFSNLPLIIHVVDFQRVGSQLAHKHRGNIYLLHYIHWNRTERKCIFDTSCGCMNWPTFKYVT